MEMISFQKKYLSEYSKDSGQVTTNNVKTIDENTPEHYRIYYITDIHIDHKIADKYTFLRPSKNNISKFVSNYVENAFKKYESSTNSLFFIGGDVSHDPAIVQLFFTELIKYVDAKQVIVILGNHEIWNVGHTSIGNDVDSIIDWYRIFFKSLNITLIQNDIVLIRSDRTHYYIKEKEILDASPEEIKEECARYPIVIFGGIGFSGYEHKYNASSGIYRDTIPTISCDLKMTVRFEKLYDKLRACLSDYPLIIFTHMPVECWSKGGYESNWIYVNGHTHRNVFVNDGDKLVYSDNQVGYHCKTLNLSYFDVNKSGDLFRYLKNGMYEIDSEQYCDFNHLSGISMQFNSSGKILMLKNSGVYCFLLENEKGCYMLDGGRKKIVNHDPSYYYNNLEAYFEMVMTATQPFRNRLSDISRFVKSFGGSGKVHGSIVDIDFYNHLYLNYLDGKITPYFAEDTVEKYVYRNLASLLSEESPGLYDNYCNLIGCNDSHPACVSELCDNSIDCDRELYRGMDIYRNSKKAKGFEYMSKCNVIRQWDDGVYQKYESDHLLENHDINVTCISKIEEQGNHFEVDSFFSENIYEAAKEIIASQLKLSKILTKIGAEVPTNLIVNKKSVKNHVVEFYGYSEYTCPKEVFLQAIDKAIRNAGDSL